MKIFPVLTSAVLLLVPLVATTDETSQPNFIVFLTDDQGGGDLAYYGHPVIKSPTSKWAQHREGGSPIVAWQSGTVRLPTETPRSRLDDT